MSSPASRLRSAALGAISGFVLSAARAPLGIDWASIPAVSGGDMALFGAVALFAVAAWLARAKNVSVVVFVWSVCAGFAIHGLLLANAFELSGHIALLALVGVASIAVWSLTQRAQSSVGDEVQRSWVELAGITIASFGTAWSLYAVARPTLLLGGGLPQDDSVFASVFLLLVAFGATAFGAWFTKCERARVALPVLLVLTCAVCFEPLSALAKFSDRVGFESFFRSPPWSLTMLNVGMLSGDSLVGARVFVVPALVLGTALVCARTPRTLASIAIGAALARASWPWFVEAQSASTPDAIADLANARLAIAIAVAAAGSALTLLATAFDGRMPKEIRVWCGGLILGLSQLVVFAWCGPRGSVLPLSPWEIAQPKPLWLRDTAEGLLTVELDHNGNKVATLDRHRLTPVPDEEAVEALCFERARGANVVFLVGQLTPSRAAALQRIGVERIDRTAPWWRSMAQIEVLLFNGTEIPLGAIVDPDRPAENLPSMFATVVLATTGTSPHLEDFDTPFDPRIGFWNAAWVESSDNAAHRATNDNVLVAADGVEHLRIGFTNAGDYPAGEPFGPLLPLASLMKPQFVRAFENMARTTKRLAIAARGTEHEQLMTGLALHYAAQVESSPFETASEQIELDEYALELMRDAALAREPDAFTRELWNGLARTLTEKRDVERIDRYLKPLAERWAPWPRLEGALAIADLEMLEPASAARRLEIAITDAPRDVDLRLLRGRALVLADQPALAVQEFERALALAPARRDIERELAMARVRAGDPAGKAAVEALLRQDSSDSELKSFLGDGPFPTPQPALQLLPRHGEH